MIDTNGSFNIAIGLFLQKAGGNFQLFHHIENDGAHAVVAESAKHPCCETGPVELREVAAFIGADIVHGACFAIEELAWNGI